MNSDSELPTNIELAEMKQLRDSVVDLKLCDEALSNINLLRFVRARNHNIKDAEEMLRNYVKWHDEFGLSTLLTENFSEEICKVNAQPLCGYDNHGGPIMLSPLGRMNISSILNAGQKDKFIRHTFQLYERNGHVARLQMKSLDAECYFPTTCIADLDGLSWRQFTPDVVSTVLTITQYLEAYFPETTRNLVFINTPAIFTFFWKIAKPFVSERTLKKILIFGTDRRQWEEAILKLAAEDQIPMKYGGTAPDDIDISPSLQDCRTRKRGSY